MHDLDPQVERVRALAFDVFGTVVDWRESIAAEAAIVAARHGLSGHWYDFADAWRAGYAPAMQRVRIGDLPWSNIDQLHRLILDSLLERFKLDGLGEAERTDLTYAWHRLAPWDDSVEGLGLLKKRFTITTLSNGSFALLTNLAKHGGLPWDCIISAELFNHYKPDPETYLGAARLLDIAPSHLMLVAAHPDDLRAARRQGLKTAFVRRFNEFGAGRYPYQVADDEFDVTARDFIDLARKLNFNSRVSPDK